MNYKAIISDLDGTLLNSNHKVSDYTKKIVKEVVNEGTKFFIATGRHHKDVEFIREQLELDTILITSNGSRVHNTKKEKLSSYDLEEGIVEQILNIELDDEIHVNIYQEDRWLVERENEWINEFHEESNFFYEVKDFRTIEKVNTSKVFFICENHDKLVKLKERLEKEFHNKINIAFSLPICLEVMPYGVSKAAALEEVLKKHDINLEEAVAFGDGLNDLEMLKVVGKGLIMGNAHDALKEALPNHEVIDTNDDDGVAKYIKSLFL